MQNTRLEITETMIKKWKIVFPSPDGPDERLAYIYLPASYQKDPDRRYPVLYMFDGHNVFFDSDATYGKCWGMKEYMDNSKTELIIAAVECNHSPDHGRLKEYSPYDFEDHEFGAIPGFGKSTMEWLVHTFKKDIDERFRTLPDREHTYIAGSSMGGLMSLYAVLEYNDYFSGAAALSPSIWTNPARIEKLILNAKLHQDTRIYMDYGSREMRFHRAMERQFQKVTSLLLRKRVFLTSIIVPYGDHCEACWEKQIPIFMNTLLYEGYR